MRERQDNKAEEQTAPEQCGVLAIEVLVYSHACEKADCRRTILVIQLQSHQICEVRKLVFFGGTDCNCVSISVAASPIETRRNARKTSQRRWLIAYKDCHKHNGLEFIPCFGQLREGGQLSNDISFDQIHPSCHNFACERTECRQRRRCIVCEACLFI